MNGIALPNNKKSPYKTWEEREAERDRRERTYFDVEKFIRHFREDRLMDQFILDEGTFTEMVGRMEADHGLAKEVSDKGIVLLMKADKGFEINGVIEIAQVIAEESGG